MLEVLQGGEQSSQQAKSERVACLLSVFPTANSQLLKENEEKWHYINFLLDVPVRGVVSLDSGRSFSQCLVSKENKKSPLLGRGTGSQKPNLSSDWLLELVPQIHVPCTFLIR